MSRKQNKPGRILFFVALIVYSALAIFSVYWLDEITAHLIGSDFRIYYLAYMDARTGDNPYLPYDIGTSYVYHPFALTFLSLFSSHQNNEVVTLRAWIAAAAVAWLGTLWLMVRLLKPDFLGARRVDNGPIGVMLSLILLGFGPLWETLHTGQINTFVVLFLYLSFYLAETDWDIVAGLFLALAVVLKTSPLIFLGYFFVIARYRVVWSTVAWLVIFTLIPAIQFSPRVVWDFLNILPLMGAEIHAKPYNQSVLSLTFRLAKAWGHAAWGNALILAHKALFGGLLAGLLGMTWLLEEHARPLRFWLFCALVTAMTFFSPLVWYHHSIFLALPLAALLVQRSKGPVVVGVGILLLLQVERAFEQGVLRAAIPVLLAQLALLVVCVGIFLAEWKELQHVRGTRPFLFKNST